jgi:hypothetical protein
LAVAALRQQLQEKFATLLHAAAPEDVCYTFDEDAPTEDGPRSSVQKTTRRAVRSLRFGGFQARQIIRYASPGEASCEASPVSGLRALVPRGCKYAYDLIAHVGVEHFLKGRTLQELHQTLPGPKIPFSSFAELPAKFLFYLGGVHRLAAPKIRDFLAQEGEVAWLIDGTVELDSPVYFGVKEAKNGLFLASRKMPTENERDIAGCLSETARQYGTPAHVFHDLSDVIDAACERALPNVAHWVCQFYLLQDIGEDLFDKPQQALSQCVRRLKLKSRMKEQRRSQTKWLRQQDVSPAALGVLADALQHGVGSPPNPILSREVLLAFHQWILDYAHDGNRWGFPFDPYLLYFHRRVVKASQALARLLCAPPNLDTPRTLVNLSNMLQEYLDDAQVAQASANYEASWSLFQSLRSILRFVSSDSCPRSDAHLLCSRDQRQAHQALADFRQLCREEVDGGGGHHHHIHQIVLTHLDRYWERLPCGAGHCPERTTNQIEGHWRRCKRGRRQVHGRSKVTKDFQWLPEEYMLLPNLENEVYVELALGDFSQLPQQFAVAGAASGPFSAWRDGGSSLNVGRLPKRLLRRDNLLHDLVGVYAD